MRVLYVNARRYRQSFAMIIGDVDHFKRINDHISHSVGDEVLSQVAKLLQAGGRNQVCLAD